VPITVFWLGITNDIKNNIASCHQCQMDAPRQQKETLLLYAVPEQPWTKVGINLFEYNHTHYLTIVDYTTDYLEYIPLNNQTTETVINSYKALF